jgi:hypothetical protein
MDSTDVRIVRLDDLPPSDIAREFTGWLEE